MRSLDETETETETGTETVTVTGTAMETRRFLFGLPCCSVSLVAQFRFRCL